MPAGKARIGKLVARTHRKRILASDTWLSGEHVAGRLRCNPADLRAVRHIFAVWNRRVSEYFYPAFQFCGASVRRDVPELLAALGSVLDRDLSGWTVALWLYTPDPELAASEEWDRPAAGQLAATEAPAAVFARDPQRVIDLARKSFQPLSIDPLDSARKLRDRLLQNEAWFNAPDVAAALADTGNGVALDQLEALRRGRAILAARWRGSYYFPAFQFDDRRKIRARTDELVRLLPNEPTGWAATFWCFQPTGHLLDVQGRPRRPADTFARDADAVIAAAQREFYGCDADW